MNVCVCVRICDFFFARLFLCCQNLSIWLLSICLCVFREESRARIVTQYQSSWIIIFFASTMWLNGSIKEYTCFSSLLCILFAPLLSIHWEWSWRRKGDEEGCMCSKARSKQTQTHTDMYEIGYLKWVPHISRYVNCIKTHHTMMGNWNPVQHRMKMLNFSNTNVFKFCDFVW